MKNRSELREVIMKILYQIEILRESKISYDLESLMKEQLEVESSFVKENLEAILEKEDEIIALDNKYLKEWTMDRLNKVDQAILKLATYELMDTETPSVVAINEAIELSKKYSEEAVTKMINGVLDKIYHEEGKDE